MNPLDAIMFQNSFMISAMRIMEVFCDMSFAHRLNPDKVDRIDSIERLQLFCDWTKEFEEEYHGTNEYEDDYIGLSDEFAQKKLLEEFGREVIV